MTDLQDSLRAEVRACLTSGGISQAAAARALGITPKHMSQMLLGNATMSLDWAQKIAEMCGREIRIVTRKRRRPRPRAPESVSHDLPSSRHPDMPPSPPAATTGPHRNAPTPTSNHRNEAT